MSITVRRNNKGSISTYTTSVDKVAGLIQLFNRLGFEIIKVEES